MAGDRQDQGTADPSRIDVNDDREIRYWSRKFGLTKQQLRQVVNGAGPHVADVKRLLGYEPSAWSGASVEKPALPASRVTLH